MKGRGLLLPMVVAIIAALIYFFVLDSAKKSAVKDSQPVTVFVALRDLPAKKVLTEGDYRLMRIPRQYVQKDAIEYKSEADLRRVKNLITQIKIPRDNQITTNALYSQSAQAGLAAKVTSQYRGYVLTGIEPEVTSMLKPEDKIDILLTVEATLKGSPAPEKVTATLFQNVVVLGVGNDLGQGMDAAQLAKARDREADSTAFSNSSAISLALSPEDAQYLTLAKSEGDLSITIRNATDGVVTSWPLASFSRLFKQ